MARGLTALRAALGAVGGVTDALQERERIQREQAQKDEALAYQRASLMGQLGFRPTLYQAATATEMPVAPASATDRTALTTALQRGMGVEAAPAQPDMGTTAFQRAMQRGMGVEPNVPETAATRAFQQATSGALASSYTQRTPETPGVRQTLPGNMEIAWQPEKTDEEKLAKALAALPENMRAEYEPVVRAAYAGVPSNVIQTMVTPREPREPRANRLQLIEKTGQIVNLDTGEVTSAKGYIQPPKEPKEPKGPDKPDPVQLRFRAGMNEMLLADQGMRNFENKGIKITLKQQVLRKLATDFSNEKEPLDKIISSTAYQTLARDNPELSEYMRNVDAYAEGESMVAGRQSNFRTKMAQLLSGIANESPEAVVKRVQQRRRGILAPFITDYHGGDWNAALKSAGVESGADTEQPTPQPNADKMAWANAWKASNSKQANESNDAYLARMTQAYRASGGK